MATVSDVVTVAEPARVSLSGLPNFLTVEGKRTGARTRFRASVRVQSPTPLSPLVAMDAEGNSYSVRGVIDRDEVGRGTFLIVSSPADTAANLAEALRGIDWIDERYVVGVPVAPAAQADTAEVRLEARAAGAAHNLAFEQSRNWVVTIEQTGADGDALLAAAGEGTARIDVDLYSVDADADDAPLLTLSKSYAGDPVWFDINAAVAAPRTYRPPQTAPGVFEAATVRGLRAVAHLGGVINTRIYVGDALHVIHGDGSLAVGGDLSAYVVGPGPGRLLSDAPARPWTPDTPLYVNALIGPAAYENEAPLYFRIDAFDAGGGYVGEVLSPVVPRTLRVATWSVDTEALEGLVARGARRLHATMGQAGAAMSDALWWDVADPCLRTVWPVTFLNRLGGWEVYDFGAAPESTYDVSPETYERTVQPGFRRGDSVEAVYDAGLTRTRKLVSPPVSPAVGRWLAELAASPAVFDPEGDALVVTGFTLTVADEGRDLVRPELEYHLSEGGAYA